MRKVLIFSLLILFTSCALTRQQKEDNRVVKKLDKIKRKHPQSFRNVTTELVRIDTFIPEVDHSGELIVSVDTAAVDSLTQALKALIIINNNLNLEVEGRPLSDEIRNTITRYLPTLINIDSLNIDTLGVQAKVWYNKDKGLLNYQFHKDEQHIIAERPVKTITIDNTKVVNRIPWWIWAIMIGLGVVTLLAMLKR